MEYLQLLEPWMIPIVVMVCVTLIVIVTSVTSIIKTSMKRKQGTSLSENKEFLNALRDFKENMERRVANLEEIASAESSRPASKKHQADNKQKQSAIQLEMDSDARQEKQTGESSKLKNMLNQ